MYLRINTDLKSLTPRILLKTSESDPMVGLGDLA